MLRNTSKKPSNKGIVYTLLVVALISCSLLLASCAMVFPVSSPDISAKEYQVMVSSNNKAAKCYSKGFRGVTLALDIILFWPATIVDAAGGFYTYYYYDPIYCAENQVTVDEPTPKAKKKAKKPARDEYSEYEDDDEDEVPVVKKAPKKVAYMQKAEEPVAKPVKKQKKISRPIYVAVLESASGGILEYQETQFITNVLREEAVRALSSESNATIMTRENIVAMLPPEKSLEECEGSCLIETGKNISADYVSQARIGKFGKNLTISVELYKTSNGKLIASFNTKAPDIDYLEESVRAKASQMFLEIIEQETND